MAQCQHPTPPQPHSGRAFAGKLSRQLVISWTGLKNVYVVRVCVCESVCTHAYVSVCACTCMCVHPAPFFILETYVRAQGRSRIQ